MTDSPGTTTWYAFQDPKTGREYFHEPVSGDTSWVHPGTSSANATDTERRKEASAPGSTLTSKGAKNVKIDDTRGPKKQKDGWSAVAITIVSILLFNTLFLLVLVRFLYNGGAIQIGEPTKASNDGVGTVMQPRETGIDHVQPIARESNDAEEHMQDDAATEAEPESELEDEQTLPVDEIMANDAMGTVEDHSSSTDSPELPDAKVKETRDATNALPPDESSETKVDNGDLSSDGLNGEKDGIVLDEDDEQENVMTEETKDIAEETNHAWREPIEWPVVCAVPFSYLFVGKCRRHAREGLPMPLVDAEKSVWI